jgi:hypothetical protein
MDTENTDLTKGWEFPDQFLKKRTQLHRAAVSGVYDKCRKACWIHVPNIMTSRTSILAALSTVKITYRTQRFDTMSENTGHITIWLRVVLVEKLACCFLNNRQAHESSYL